jgi:hypothetical protein
MIGRRLNLHHKTIGGKINPGGGQCPLKLGSGLDQ